MRMFRWQATSSCRAAQGRALPDDVRRTELAACHLHPQHLGAAHPGLVLHEPDLSADSSMLEDSWSQQAGHESAVGQESMPWRSKFGNMAKHNASSAAAPGTALAGVHQSQKLAGSRAASHHDVQLSADRVSQHGIAQQSDFLPTVGGPSDQEVKQAAAAPEEYTFDSAMLDMPMQQLGYSKEGMRQRLAFLSSCYPIARPSQGMLKQVHHRPPLCHWALRNCIWLLKTWWTIAVVANVHVPCPDLSHPLSI